MNDAVVGATGERDTVDASPRAAMPARRFWLAVGGLWLLASLVLLILYAQAIARHDFSDVDDQLRLVEVRDWLAGQSFADLTQYRMNAPFGVPMHWSRLVDMPLALVIVLLRPLLGPATAETVAAVAIPLFTFAVIMAVVAAIGRRLAGPGVGVIAAGLCTLCIPTVRQITPLRVDHHGWEIAFQLLGLFGVLDRRPRRGACVAALALAAALQISLEPLPFTAAVGATLGLWWALAPSADQKQRLTVFLVVLAVSEWSLFGLLHAPSTWGAGFCDAVSPPQLLLFGVSALGIVAVTSLPLRSRLARLFGLGAAALCAAAAYRAYPPHCGVDAFDTLEPIVRRLWYDRVLEGLPFWHLPPVLAASTIGFPLVGTLCAAFAARDQHGDRRRYWIVYAVLLFAATIAAALVQRAAGLASAAATPAAAWALVRLLPAAARSKSMPIRVFGSVLLCLALSPPAATTTMAALTPAEVVAGQSPATGGGDCTAGENIAGLSALPRSRLLVPLDLGPPILFWTAHMPLASGHHRNHVAMAQVLTAFTGSQEVAHAIVRARGIRYVLFCPRSTEVFVYEQAAPHGFAAALVAGRTPPWLAPVRLPGDPIRIWRVLD